MKSKMQLRLFSLALTISMLFSVAASPALATTVETPPAEQQVPTEAVLNGVDGIQTTNNTSSYAYTYVNYYDSSVQGNTSIIQRMAGANNFVSLAFNGCFNVTMYADYSPTYRNTIIESCSQHADSPCTDACSTNCSGHHKNLVAISDQLYYDQGNQTNHIYVLWTNREEYTYCTNETSGHTISDRLAMVYQHRPIIHFCVIAGGNGTTLQTAYMGLVLAHETAHVFGMTEAYLDPIHEIANGTECVMEAFDAHSAYQFYDNVQRFGTDAFCEQCRNFLLGLPNPFREIVYYN